ncbi:MAG: iron-containing alcohol dehydrogenase [Treponema sp.]|jgi:alcohol dehydrogenase|nr:iron-containing alcohol dehydrogenase [Treponema sp.]
MDISFKFDPEILIGADTLSMAGPVCRRFGKRIMVVSDRALDPRIMDRLKEILEDSGIDTIVFNRIEEESTIETAGNIVELSQAAHCDALIGVGSQKTQIISRMAAITAPSKISAFELLDGRIHDKFLPLIAIPVEGLDAFSLTEYFIAVDPRNRLIKSVQSPSNLYAAVIIDSSLFGFLSGSTAFNYVFDGFFSAAEAYCSAKANFLSDILLEKALNFYAKMLKNGGSGINADNFAQASFLTALGSSASSPGIGAALPYAISARFPVQKQLCSAVLFPHIIEKLVNARPEKIARVAAFLGIAGKGASVAETANSAAESIRRSMASLGIKPDLKEFSIQLDRLTAAVETARSMEFVANSPWTVSQEDVFEIMKKII